MATHDVNISQRLLTSKRHGPLGLQSKASPLAPSLESTNQFVATTTHQGRQQHKFWGFYDSVRSLRFWSFVVDGRFYSGRPPEFGTTPSTKSTSQLTQMEGSPMRHYGKVNDAPFIRVVLAICALKCSRSRPHEQGLAAGLPHALTAYNQHERPHRGL